MKQFFKRAEALALAILLCLTPLNAEAAKLSVNTLLDHPDFGDTSYCPDNRFYDTNNIHAAIWSYGYECNTLNLNGIDAVVSEVLNEVSKVKSPSKYKNRWFSLWTEGADMSKKNLDDLYDAGWNILGLTYYDYWIETVLTPIETDYYTPRFNVVNDESVRQLLAAAGHDLEKYPVGMITVSGVSMPCRSCVFYCPDFTFLSKKTVHGYRYYPEVGLFVKLDEVNYNSYKKKFLDIYYGKKGKDGNGLFVFSTVELPEALVTTEDKIELPKESVPEEKNDSLNTSTDMTDDTGDEKNGEADNSQIHWDTPIVEEDIPEESGELNKETDEEPDPVYNQGETPADKTVKIEGRSKEAVVAEWIFKNGNVPSNFNGDATVGWTGSNEVTVDFDYSGPLPEGTIVTLYLPFNKSGFKDGDVLYLYYCNPTTGLRELAGSGLYNEGLVSFSMSHCSEYIVTDVNHGEVYKKEESKPITGIVLACTLGALVAVGGVVLFIRKKK